MLKIGHTVSRPGKKLDDPPVTIPVPAELETVPGIPTNQREVDWYSREYPLETMNITERASTEWRFAIRDGHTGMREMRKEHLLLDRPLILATLKTPGLEPTAEPTGEDVSQLVKDKARELGYLDVGITAYDHRYDYVSRKDFVKFPHAMPDLLTWRW